MLKEILVVSVMVTSTGAIAERDVSKRVPAMEKSEGLKVYKAYMNSDYGQNWFGKHSGDYKRSYEWYTNKTDRLARRIEYKINKLQNKIDSWKGVISE